MAIVQISQITNRKGLQIDLPDPLAGAELGWSTDTRQLWIGNGTLEEGAPVVGNTEILTEFSDIITSAKYTYSGDAAAGYAAQTGPTVSQPIIVTQQDWMDQWASVKDFGAVGDGSTDDTDAINRALYQLYCNPAGSGSVEMRRSLFFPAGTYVITDTISIPTYATLYGEGPDNTIISLQPTTPGDALYVAAYADSNGLSGYNSSGTWVSTVGSTGGDLPTDIHIANMQFENTDLTTNIFLVQSAKTCSFDNVAFAGIQNSPTTAGSGTVGVGFNVASRSCAAINFTQCVFTGTTYVVNATQSIESIVFDKSYFYNLYQGLLLGAVGATGPTGTRITNSTFDRIYSSGIIIGTPGSGATLNASSQNIFYDVGNSYGGTATAYIIGIYSDNNVSIGDMFERSASGAIVYPRIYVDGQNTIAVTNGEQIEMGSFTRKSGLTVAIPAPTGNVTLFTQDVTVAKSFSMNYSIVQSGNVYRTGVFAVASLGGGSVTYQDDFVENATTNIILSATQASGNNTVIVQSAASTTGGTMYYSINYLS